MSRFYRSGGDDRLRGGNKRCHKLPFERVRKPPPRGSNSLFIGLRAILACRHVAQKIFLSGFDKMTELLVSVANFVVWPGRGGNSVERGLIEA